MEVKRACTVFKCSSRFRRWCCHGGSWHQVLPISKVTMWDDEQTLSRKRLLQGRLDGWMDGWTHYMWIHCFVFSPQWLGWLFFSWLYFQLCGHVKLSLVVLSVVWPYEVPWQWSSKRTSWSKEWHECKDSFNLKHTALFGTGHRISFHPLIFCRGLQRLDFYLSERRPGLVQEWTTVLFRCSQGGPWGRSVCKVISQSPEWFADTLAHQRHDTALHQCCGSRKNIYIYFDRKWRGRQSKAFCVLTFIRKGWVTYSATNSTNGRFYDRVAQTKRVSAHCISDKRRLEMLAVRPLIRWSNIWNQPVCLKRGRLHSSQRKLKAGNCWLDEPKEPTPFPTTRPERTPKSAVTLPSLSQHT